MLNEVKQSIDQRYGRAGTVVDADDRYVPTTPKNNIARRFVSRGGFSASKSDYINDGLYENKFHTDLFDRTYKNVKPLNSFQRRYTVTQEDNNFDDAPQSGSRYVRKSGFGKTTKNMDYGAKLTYSKPLSYKEIYADAMAYRAQPSQEAKRYFTSKYQKYSKNRESAADKGLRYNLDTVSTVERPRYSHGITYLDRPSITEEEYRLFTNFSTPSKVKNRR